jgi:hypothetical protein
MTLTEWFDAFSLMHGINPRPQPWQVEIIERYWARRLEQSKQKPTANEVDITYRRHKPMKVEPFLMSTNWGSGRLWSAWTFARKPDETGVIVLKSRSVGCSWAPTPEIRGWSGNVMIDDPHELRVKQERAVIDFASSMAAVGARGSVDCVTATNDTATPKPTPKKAREPFYGKFLPKRRLK